MNASSFTIVRLTIDRDSTQWARFALPTLALAV